MEPPPSKKSKTTSTSTSPQGINAKLNNYSKITRELVKCVAEANGVTMLSNEAVTMMVEQTTWNMQELAGSCSRLLLHKKRRKLTCEDMKEVLKQCRAPVALGHSGGNPKKYCYVKEAKVFVEEDPEIDLMTEVMKKKEYQDIGSSFVKVDWMKNSNGPAKPEDLSPEHQAYMKQLKIAMTDKNHKYFEFLECDMRSNLNLRPLVPYILAIVTAFLKGALMGGTVPLRRSLRLVGALLRNNSLPEFRCHRASLNLLAPSMLFCASYLLPRSELLEEEMALMQEKVVFLVSELLNGNTSIVSQLSLQTSRSLKSLLSDTNLPLMSHHGVLLLLEAMGPRYVEQCFLPLLKDFEDKVESAMDVVIKKQLCLVRKQVHLCVQVLRRAFGRLLLHHLRNDGPSCATIYAQCYERLGGDAMIPFLPVFVEVPAKEEEKLKRLQPKGLTRIPKIIRKRNMKQSHDVVFERVPLRKKTNIQMNFGYPAPEKLSLRKTSGVENNWECVEPWRGAIGKRRIWKRSRNLAIVDYSNLIL